MAGETRHQSGFDGARRAKEWLEATTRVQVPWVVPEPYAVCKLTFHWADTDSTTFSYDLGGRLIGEDLEGQEFLAEVKNYKGASDQAELYVEYLAKCYRAYQERPDRCDNFMWITWAPFSVTKWQKLCSCDEVLEAVVRHRDRALGEPDLTKAHIAVDKSCCDEVANRLWIIVLSERQESLVVTRQHRGVIQMVRATGYGG